MMNLVEIRKAQPGQIPFKKSSCYKFSSTKRFPNLIYKVAGILVFDLNEWEKMAQDAKAKNVKQAAGLRAVKV